MTERSEHREGERPRERAILVTRLCAWYPGGDLRAHSLWRIIHPEDTKKSLYALRDSLRQFAEERDWEQFHSPKNLATALVVEAGELVEQFQWLTDEESRTLSTEKLGRVSEELADVLLYLIRLADKLDVDLLQVANKKIETNHAKYPIEKSRGSSRKYNEL